MRHRRGRPSCWLWYRHLVVQKHHTSHDQYMLNIHTQQADRPVYTVKQNKRHHFHFSNYYVRNLPSIINKISGSRDWEHALVKKRNMNFVSQGSVQTLFRWGGQCVNFGADVDMKKHFELLFTGTQNWNSHVTGNNATMTRSSSNCRDSACRRSLYTPIKVIYGRWFWYQSKGRMQLPISQWY